jgi:uncharacterized membrane protein
MTQSPPPRKRRATDLTLVVALLGATVAVVLLDGPTVLRLPLVALAVLFAPGYALTVALFPAGTPTAGDSATIDRAPTVSEQPELNGGISLLERFVLSVGLSLAAVPLAGIAVDTLAGELSTATLLAGVSTVTLGGVALAALRRRRVAPVERFDPVAALQWRSRTGRPGASGRPSLALTAALVLSLVFAGGALALTQTGGDAGPAVTEVTLLTPDEDGALRPEGFPTSVPPDTDLPLSVSVANRAGDSGTYTLVGQLQRADRTDDGPVVRSRRTYETASLTVPANGTQLHDVAVTPTATGSHRVVVLLYRGDVPDEPRIANADREVHLWVDVNESASG